MSELKLLVRSAQTQDPTAFGALVERFQDMAYALAYAKVTDPQQAEDIAQESFIEAYLHIDLLESPHAFTSWFRTIVNRQINRYIRAKRPLLCSLEHVIEDKFGVFDGDGATPESHAERKEMQETIHAAIHALPENERQAILLFYIGGYSQKEIAETLEIRQSTVKSRLYEARQRLRERMSQMVEDYLQEQRPSNDPKFAQTVMEFIDALEMGNTSKAAQLIDRDERLLETPIKLSWRTDMLPPLFLAIEKGNVALIEYLLSKGVDVNGKDAQGFTPHFYALNWRHPVDIPAYLRERGAIPDIYSITWMGKLDQLKALVEERPTLVHERGPEGGTLLHFAPTVEMAQYLLDKGADINILDDTGKPPVVRRFIKEVRQFLLKQGAVINDIMFACEVGAMETVEAMLDADPQLAFFKTDNGTTPLLRAALNGHAEIVKRILALNDNVNYTNDGWGFAPIHAAALSGNLETVQLLLEHGSDISVRMRRAGETALHWAVDKEDPTIARYLLEKGAEVNAQTKQGATPLHWSVKRGNLECIKLLLEKGADPHITSELMEESPLMRARRLGRDEIVRMIEG